MTIKEAIEKGNVMLKGNNIDTPKLKSRLIMQYLLNKPRQYLIVHDNDKISKIQEQKYMQLIERIKDGIPIEHITHQKEFMKLNFYVSEDVLIPRQDTEILVEEVIKISRKCNAKEILDLCTGSGAIAISLAKYISNSQITAIDISEKALNIAKKNAKINSVENQITFVKSDIFKSLSNTKFDIIVCNPPYIKSGVIKTLDEDVKKEPLIALDGGIDGLEFYRNIIAQSYQYLKYGGYLCLEIGYDQKVDVIQLIENEEKYISTYCKKDLYGNDRVIITNLSD